MKRWLLIYFVVLVFNVGKTQSNLVPNWSFETITQCPINFFGNTTTTLATPWQNPSKGTPDLFSVCDTQPCAPGNPPCNGVPLNGAGLQNPHSGNNYAGIFVYTKPDALQYNIREYLQVKLIDSLKKNKNYCMSYYISVADSASNYATSRIGCYISQGAVTNTNQDLISVTPQIQNTFHNYLTNKVNWSKIQGQYTSNGNENFITIGNFYDDSNTDTLYIGGEIHGIGSYYYIDDVSLIEMQIDAGRDTTSCAGQSLTIGEVTIDSSFNSYHWYNNAGMLIDSSHNQISVHPNTNAIYVLEKRMCGQSFFDTIYVRVKPIVTGTLVVTANTNIICLNDTAKLNAQVLNSNNNTWSYLWQTTQSISSTIISNPYVYPQTTTSYIVSAENTDTSFCNFTETASITIRVKQRAKGSLVVNSANNFVCINSSYFDKLSAEIENSNTNKWIYDWQPATLLINSNSSNPIIKELLSTQIFTITIQSTDTNLCPITYMDTLKIVLIDCNIIVPNIFSPNGDGINDTWSIKVIGDAIQNSIIYNRWGIKVFETDNSNQAWDGRTTSGIECSADTYFYLISYKDGKTNNQQTLKGFLQLIK